MLIPDFFAPLIYRSAVGEVGCHGMPGHFSFNRKFSG